MLAEFCFLLDIIVNFFIEYKSEEKLQPIRDIAKIAERYLKGTFLLDLISFFPFIPIVIAFTASEIKYSIDDVSYDHFGYL